MMAILQNLVSGEKSNFRRFRWITGLILWIVTKLLHLPLEDEPIRGKQIGERPKGSVADGLTLVGECPLHLRAPSRMPHSWDRRAVVFGPCIKHRRVHDRQCTHHQ